MKPKQSLLRSSVAVVTAWSLTLSTAAPLLAQTPSASPAATTVTNANLTTASSSVQPVVEGWPRQYTTPSGKTVILYQPQVATWENQKKMTAFSAVELSSSAAAKPDLGTVKIEADTAVAVEERLVRFANLHIVEASFATLAKESTREVVAEIEKAIPDDDRVISLDRVLAAVDRSQILPKNVDGVRSEPPKIFSSKTPAVLVNLDGPPVWSPIKENDLKFAVNTNWDLFSHEPTKTFYLRNDTSWLQATDVAGPWTPAASLPDSFAKLPSDNNWADAKAALPLKKLDPKHMPTVFVSQEPAELILLEGAPREEPVAGAEPLLWVSNTESDLFRMGKTGSFYYLVAGRWFSAVDLAGPWVFATPSLPPEFAKIPLEHKRSRVLASVPGTQQAAEAVLLAQVPQTARVSRKEAKAPEVVYQGDPKFEPIEKTSMQRAVNTDKAIIKVGDVYYMCFEGVWFMGQSPEGPWTVTSQIPGEIYTIPASDPLHNVTYVTVEDSNDDYVTYAAVAGYTGMMVAYGCTVWGSGWYYPPYYWGGGYYPYYPTYGYGARYNPWTGAYSAGVGVYGPYGGAGYGARYNPRTGTYARGAAAYGPGGTRYGAAAYNPRTGTSAATRGGSNVYGNWSQTAAQRGDSWAQSSRYTNNATGNTTRKTTGSGGGSVVTRRGSDGGGGFAGKTGGGDMYAGRDGNVYKNTGGGWQKYDNGSWNNVDRPTQQGNQNYQNLNRDAAARAEGARRSSDYNRVQSTGSRNSSGSYRGSSGGGGYRGGGGGGGMRGGGGGGRGGGGRR